jgi:hypothetical protein
MPLKLEHRIGVQAPGEIVWEILADVAAWPQWSVIYPEAAGVIGFGERLTLTRVLPGQSPEQIQPRVIDWGPVEAIHWRTSVMGGWVNAVRYLEVEVMSEAGCIFSNGELFTGLLSNRIPRARRIALRAGFTALGESLRDRAEALWQERSSGAT